MGCSRLPCACCPHHADVKTCRFSIGFSGFEPDIKPAENIDARNKSQPEPQRIAHDNPAEHKIIVERNNGFPSLFACFLKQPVIWQRTVILIENLKGGCNFGSEGSAVLNLGGAFIVTEHGTPLCYSLSHYNAQCGSNICIIVITK